MVTYVDEMAMVIEVVTSVSADTLSLLGLEPGRPGIRNESESHSTGTEMREVLGVVK
jgi:hypothetical protein